ncbi:MAG: AzlD domain-containing protein [Oscillibacter sp.]|nr:AzlD domain-containing protein [Oscillibacter sp.]
MRHQIWLYLAVMATVCYAIRVLPLTLLRKRIQNRFLRSFLYYVPYVTLSVMTFPAILYATGSPLIGGLAMAAGVVSAWFGANSFVCAVVCSGSVFLLGLFL